MIGRAIGAIAIAAAAATLVWQVRLGAEAPHSAAPRARPSVPVAAGVVVARDMPVLLHGIGTVQAYNTVAVKTRVDGQIVKIDFTEGQEVKAGAPLLRIDPRPFQAALEQAEANRQKDEAQLSSAEADLARYGKLVGSGYQTRQSYDQQKGLVAQFTAAIKGDQAQIDNAKLNLAYTDIRAPIDGRLGARLVDVGNLVRASDNTVLVTINQIKPIFVSFTLPENTVDEVRRRQQSAPLVVEAISRDGKTPLARGMLTLIDNAIDQATGTIRLKATFANADERLWPGEFVNVRMVVRMRRGVATVPSQTVQEGPKGHYAYVIKPGDTVERRAVTVASIQDGLAVVTKGLSPGERVVVDGQYRLTNGARVKPLAAPGRASPAG